MKTKQLKKVMIVGSVLLIGVVICVSVWFFLSKYKGREIQDQSQQSVPNINKDVNNETATVAPPSPYWEEPATRREIITRQSRKMFRSHLSEEQLANPHFQKVLEVMDSKEFAELPSSPSIHQWKDLLESKGFPVTRGNPGVFTKHPPFMSLEDYEPIVRLRIAKSFLAQEPVDMTDPKAASNLRAKVLSVLNDAEGSGFRWYLERFGDDWREAFRVHEGMESNPAVIWMTDIQQNAASIVQAAEQTQRDALKASTPSWDISSVSDASSGETEVPATVDASERATMTDTEIMAEIEKSLTPQPSDISTNQRPEPPSEIQSNLETTLKSQFSSERFDRAMDTLDQYGPEEGLRRLRENDPEIAEEVERQRKKEDSP